MPSSSPSASGELADGTFRQDAYRTASHEAPAVEAERWLTGACGTGDLPALLIVIGLAGGHVLDAVDRRSPGTKVLALEPDRRAADAFLAARRAEAWRRAGRLVYLAGPAYVGANDAWRLFPPSGEGFKLLTHPRLQNGEQAMGAARAVKEIVYGVKANAEARRRFAPRYLRNVIRNVPAIASGRDVRSLTAAYSQVPAVITAAGPSLDAALNDLRAASSRALLIAADTTLRPLLGAGIVPPLVVGADPGAANARHFADLPELPGTWLVAESALDARAAVAFGNRTLWFRLANHHPWPWLRTLGLDAGHLEMWGSVLTAAFQVAYLAGCDPIVVVGADLAFTGSRPYCRGTTYEFDWAYHAAAGTPVTESWRAQVARSQAKVVPDVRGVHTATTPALLSFRDWMLARARGSCRRVINATGAGVLYGDGVEQGTLSAALARGTVVRPLAAVIPAESPSGSLARIAGELRAVREALAAGDTRTPLLQEWRTFSGENFDEAALAAVLEEAADALRSREVDSDCPTLPGRSSVPTGPRGSVAGLAESTARLVSALRGEEIAPQGSEASSAALLVRALDLLKEIAGEALVLDALAPLSADTIDAPVAISYSWPEPLRWHVQRFEALLGDACRSAMSSSDAALAVSAAGHAHHPGPPGVWGIQACVRLVREWLRCAATQGDGPDLALRDLIGRLAILQDATQHSIPSAGQATTIIISARADAVASSVTLRLSTDGAALGESVARPQVETSALDIGVHWHASFVDKCPGPSR